ncbi:MAG: glycoside hydrolase [Firmicutes bacterium]|nr:glycoside hydrolase [Bacillota bacterium]
MGPKLYVAFLWHMHQPIYKEIGANRYHLPWVRLHGIKSYYDMGKIVEEVEGTRVTFNFTPSLLEQLIEYTRSGATDVYLEHTIKDPSDLSREEKAFILANFFHVHEEFMIRPYPRYLELLSRRGDPNRVMERVKEFTNQDFLDLQVWFNLTWFGQTIKDHDEEIHYLLRKGTRYTPVDKARLVAKQMEVLRRVIPLYRGLRDLGRIEISTSPYFHPILPLLCDTSEARVSSPGAPLPSRRFSYPEDARRHVEMGMDYSRYVFQRIPRGMWPSEGAVSDAALDLMARSGVSWTASDEEILAQTLREEGRYPEDRGFLYQPYLWEGRSGKLAVFFRDHAVSDLIGFVYHRWFTTDAVADLLHRLSNLAQDLPVGRPNLISIILDGENAWEYYYRQGYDFLTGVYRGLVEHPLLEMTTFSEYLSRFPAVERIRHVFPGSWINADFGTWVGQPVKNNAWDYLARTRETLEQRLKDDPEGRAWQQTGREMMIAEGSDWFWWFGDTHSSALDSEFDKLFRQHLKYVHESIGAVPPSGLSLPLSDQEEEYSLLQPKELINPDIDGRADESGWESSGAFSFRKGGGAMARSRYLVEKINYGFDRGNLYLRLQGEGCGWLRGGHPELIDLYGNEPLIEIEIEHRERFKVKISKGAYGPQAYLVKAANGEAGRPIERFGLEEVLELAVPLDTIGLNENDEFHLSVVVENEKGELERWPSDDYINVRVPGVSPEPDRWCT